jgi:hypothetical protein
MLRLKCVTLFKKTGLRDGVPNMPNANVPNVTVPNPNMSTRHSAECTTEPNYNVPKCQGVDVIKCRMYQRAALQWTEPTNCQTTFY